MADFLIDEDSVVSLKDIVDEEQELQDTANAVLGDSDDTNCTYSKVNLLLTTPIFVPYVDFTYGNFVPKCTIKNISP